MRYAVIMAGGAGTRLWPMSRSDQPKQLISLFNGRSLLELALERLEGVVEPERRMICTGEAFRDTIRRAIPSFPDQNILGEPTGRDTLPAVGFPASVIDREDPEAVMAIFTADHLIEPQEVFRQRVEEGFRLAERREKALITFGIQPTTPSTGYGYVQLGESMERFEHARRVRAFREKPDQQTAEQYVSSGDFVWNSGMFVWRARTLLDCIERYEPDTFTGLKTIADAWTGDRRREVLEQVYPALPKVSVDYAVMEPASSDPQVEVMNVAMDVNWLDVGDWSAYGQSRETDAQGNQVAARKALLEDTRRTLVVSEDPEHALATLGVEDLVIVHTPRTTLVCRRDQAQRVKELHGRAGEELGEEYI